MSRSLSVARYALALKSLSSCNSKLCNKIPFSLPVINQVRCMSGGYHVPAHWKSIKEVCMENKNHMNFMPVPEGSWEESYQKKQRTYNLFLISGAIACGVTYFLLYKTGCIYFHSFGDYQSYQPNILKAVSSQGGSSGVSGGSGDSAPPPTSASPDGNTPLPIGGAVGEPSESSDVEEAQLPDIPRHAPYLLIGGGTASFGAFRAIRSKDPTAKILIVGEENTEPYMRPPLSKELWFNEDQAEVTNLQFKQWNGKRRSVFYEPAEFYTEPKKLPALDKGGIALLKGRKVVKVDARKKKVWLNSGETITYDKCLIATGGKPRNLPILARADPEVKKRTILFRNVNDFKELNSSTLAADSVAIIGGGFLGSELACALGKRGTSTGLKVYQIYPEKGNMGRVLPDYLSKWTTQKVEKEGVEVIPNNSVTAATFEDGKVVLSTDGGKSVKVDCVVAAVGLEPNIELAKTSGLETDHVSGGFLVNAELEARRDLWVAGDAACFFDVKLGRRRVEHHDHAVVSGRLAGENMTGAAKPYWHQSMFWSDLGPEVGYEAIGIVDSSLPTLAVFAKSSSQDTPKAVVEATGESLRSETEMSAEAKSSDSGKVSSPTTSEDFGKGIVFYLDKQKTVVGILLWNCFNKMAVARQVLRDGAKNEDLYEVAKLFDIYDTAVQAEAAEAAVGAS